MKNQQTTSHGKDSVFNRGINIKQISNQTLKSNLGFLGFKSFAQEDPEGKFGVMFPYLTGYEATDEGIKRIASLMKENSTGEEIFGEIPLAFAFFGQFIDHDLTFDTTSKLDERLDPLALVNFRTPFLDLDCIYGANPDVDRHLYDTYGESVTPGSEHRQPFRLLTTDEKLSIDLQRNTQGTAIIGDPRNDENLFVSQIHRKIVGFHNEVIKFLQNKNSGNPLSNKELFDQARKEVTLHYHWVIKHEFLPLIIGAKLTNTILNEGLKFYEFHDNRPSIPVEFAGAAFRFGHSMIPSTYNINDDRKGLELFHVPFFGVGPINDPILKDYRGVPKEYNLDWSYFLNMGNANVQFCTKIDARLTFPLFNLPFIDAQQNPPTSLPERNMRRGRTLGLPSGQKVAEALGLVPLSNFELGLGEIEGLANEAPLWYYILKESEIQGGVNGMHLGSVGGRILGEVLIGILDATQDMIFSSSEEKLAWRPQFGSTPKVFTLADLVNYKFV